MSVQATTWVWEKSTSAGSAMLVLLAIADAANREGEQSCQSIATITRMSRLSESTVHRAIKFLLEAGEIEITGTSTRYSGTNIFRLPAMAQLGGCQIDTGGVSSTTLGGVTHDTQPQSTYPKEHTTPPSSARFDEFYKIYPRHVGKGAARSKYKAAVKKATEQQIIDGAISYAQWCKSEGTDQQFIAHPGTWLTQERWADERKVVKQERVDFGYIPPEPPEGCTDAELNAWHQSQRLARA